MSGPSSTIVLPAVTKGPGAFLRSLNECWEGIARYLVHRAAIASLRELDDRTLRDMGLTRSQIEEAVNGLMTAPPQTRT
jgi:uncharacterized protein YjiS (DUF1127 family)